MADGKLYGIIKRLILISFVGFLAFAYQSIQPPPSKICGSPNGPPVTAPRIKLRDGRYLAYKEFGVPKDKAKHKIVFIHGYSNCRHDVPIALNVSQEDFEDLGTYIVSFDRPGYGESDPNPKHTHKSRALDIEELADQLELGSKFYVIGYSMGGQAVWTCLKYIPHRLAGASLLAPVVNYWWPSFPSKLSSNAYSKQPIPDQWAFRVVHYLPWLTYWWSTQKLFPASSVIVRNPNVYSDQDREILRRYFETDRSESQAQTLQQGVFESLVRDLLIGFGNWEFDPMDLENPFPNNNGSVQVWHGDNDKLVPVTLQRYIVQRLPWIRYHEISGAGHTFPLAEGMGKILLMKALINGDTAP